MAFANRSAVWNDRCEYALALRDADLAFEANYPEGLQHKLYERKGQCLAALAKVEEAKDMLTKAIEALDKSNLKGERKKAKEKTLQKLIADLQVQDITATPKAKAGSTVFRSDIIFFSFFFVPCLAMNIVAFHAIRV